MAVGLRLACLFAALTLVVSDTYMHNPRGSNNRLNERSANRNNGNRLFDSQNNNRGGYNAGDQDTGAFSTEEQIYYMKYFQSGPDAESNLTIEWTNQHGCGGNEDNDPHKLNCNMVIQYMVQDYDGDQAVPDDPERATKIRNGVNTGTQNHQQPQNGETYATYVNRRSGSVQANRGLQESFDYYDDCYQRQRNNGLFTADQRLRSNRNGISSAIYTRQNPNGNRRGYECPEERDYYPYWHPTPWRDIAVLTDNTTLCESMYQPESFNVAPRQICRERFDTGEIKSWSQYNNQQECEENGGTWFTEYGYFDIDVPRGNRASCEARNNTDGYRRVWAPPKFGEQSSCLVLPNAPECVQVGWTRVNHLGNSRDGVPLNYTWRMPHFPSGGNKIAIVRIRYNISTDDYHPWTTNSSYNENLATGQRSPVEQNPNVNIGSTTNKPLRLAINTAQFGRTFQDRTHVMELRPRSLLPAEAQSCKINNLNVRGKRGNIVQVYPAVEYDFVPNRLAIKADECIHVQWTGSNTHNNRAPGGDGQTGDAGEGTGGTDRSNIVEIPCANCSYPIPFEQGANLFRDAEVMWSSFTPITGNNAETNALDLSVAMASAGYYHCFDSARCGEDSVTMKAQLQQLLNNAPASFEGAVLRFSNAGVYHYMCSRNNNFTNRSQKGQLTVRAAANE